MKIEEALKQDFSKMTPQQRSHLRKRILAAGLAIPPELDVKKGQSAISENDSTPDNEPWKCTVVADGRETVYTIGGDDAASKM